MYYPEPPSDYLNPAWNVFFKIHCWRNYVDPKIQDIWNTFTDEQKKILSICFEKIAGDEDWD